MANQIEKNIDDGSNSKKKFFSTSQSESKTKENSPIYSTLDFLIQIPRFIYTH